MGSNAGASGRHGVHREGPAGRPAGVAGRVCGDGAHDEVAIPQGINVVELLNRYSQVMGVK